MTDALDAPLDEFKPRELEILGMMAEGLSNKAIAERLYITTQTVRWYNKQIYSKLGTSRRTEAIALARRFGLITDDASPADTSDAAPGTPPRHTLPLTNGPFIGREDELAELSALLAGDDVRLLSLVAAGGMGKSRLSLELGHRIDDGFEHGAVFVDLTTIHNPDDVAFVALESLNIPLTGQAKPRDVLLDYCRQKTLLMIFDNWEHVLAGADLLADLLKTAPHIKLVATSRERLNLRLETVYYLEPVADDADRLFIETAQMMHSRVQIVEDDAPDVAQIVQLVGGLPLGLLLAATWADMLSVREIADEIEQSIAFLSAELGDMPERQRSIIAVIDPTWKRLDEVEKRAFMWASLFRGGFTRQMFQQMTGASVRMLQKLMERSLLMSGYQRRYDMHPLLRQYAYEKMQEMGLLDEAHAAHLNTFMDYAMQWRVAMFDGQYLEALEALETEQENFRTAMDWAFAGQNVAKGAQLAVDLCEFWDVRTHSYEGEHYMTRAVEAGVDGTQLAQVLCWRSRFRSRLGMVEASVADGRRAVALAEQHNDQPILARSLLNVANESDDAEVLPLLERALAIVEAGDDRRSIALTLNNIANYYSRTKMYEQALPAYERSQQLYTAVGDLRGISMVVYNAGLTLESMGDEKRARDNYEQSLKLKRAIGDRAGTARRMAVIASYLILEEELEQAAAYLEESVRLCEEVGDRFRLSYALIMLASSKYIATDFEGARHLLLRGLNAVDGLNTPYRTADIQNLLAMIDLAENDLKSSLIYTKQVLDNAVLAKLPYTYWQGLLNAAAYLFADRQLELCARVSAVIDRERATGNGFDVRYLLEPHLHRLKTAIGEEAWNRAQHDARSVAVEAIFEEVRDVFGNMSPAGA